MKRSAKNGPANAKPARPATKDEAARTNITLSPGIMMASEFIGRKTFGSRSAYIAHLLLNDLKSHGLSITDVLKLADQYKAKGGVR